MKPNRLLLVLLAAVLLVAAATTGCKDQKARDEIAALRTWLYQTPPGTAAPAVSSLGEWVNRVSEAVCNLESQLPSNVTQHRYCGPGVPPDGFAPPPPPPQE